MRKSIFIFGVMAFFALCIQKVSAQDVDKKVVKEAEKAKVEVTTATQAQESAVQNVKEKAEPASSCCQKKGSDKPSCQKKKGDKSYCRKKGVQKDPKATVTKDDKAVTTGKKDNKKSE